MPLPPEPESPQPLRELRRARRISQTEVALMVNEDQATISRIERGQQIPSRTQIAKFCRAFKVRAETLFDRTTLAVVLERKKAAS